MTTETTTWICTVCGYVHNGPQPPDFCPVCGATRDLFEPYREAAEAAPAPKPKRWRCLNCEHIHDGDAPPKFCPVCGVSAEHFEPLPEEVEAVAAGLPARDIVIVGAGISGISAAEAARTGAPDSRITVISKEDELPYYRLNLTRYLAGEIDEEQLAIHPESWYRENGIDLRIGTELRNIDVAAKKLCLRGEEELPYDTLILAMGSHPFMPPFPGSNRENVTVLRTRRDADFILRQCRQNLPCVVIGGGLLGLETAGALAKRGLKVTLVEGYGWLMPQQLNQKAGELLAEHIAGLGIKLCHSARVKQIEGDERVRGVALESGETLAAELVVITAGVRPNSYIARLAELEVSGGIVVDNRLRTSAEGIFAVGDVAEHRGVTYGTWGPSQFQGTIAGMNAAGGHAEFAGIPRSNSLKVLGVELFSIGRVTAEDASYRAFEQMVDGNYFFFLFRDSHLVGSILLGDTRLSAAVKQLVEKEVACTDLLSRNPQVEDILAFLEQAAP